MVRGGGRGCWGVPAPQPCVLPASSPGMPRPRVAAWQGLGSPGRALEELGRLSQPGSHMLQVFGSPVLRAVPVCLTGHGWLEPLILDYLQARESLCRAKGQ